MKKCRQCKFNKEHCPVLIGFEIDVTGEEKEADVRRKILPIFRRLYKTGERILRVKEANE